MGVCVQFKPITQADRTRVLTVAKSPLYENAEMTFTNMLLWQKPWGLELAEHKGVLFLRTNRAGLENFSFQPLLDHTADPAPVVRLVLDNLRQQGFPQKLVCVSREFCQRLCGMTPDEAPTPQDAPGRWPNGEWQNDTPYTFTPDRSLFEYIYPVPEMIALAGRRYHGKRNHIAQFHKAVPFVWHDITPEDFPAILAFEEAWLLGQNQSFSLSAERMALQAALNNFKLLGLFGAWLEIDGKMAAFTIADANNPRMAVIHFEKADAVYPGIYPALNQMFLEKRLGDVPFVNRQEDLGQEGLRRAKLSYHPCRFGEKYTLELK